MKPEKVLQVIETYRDLFIKMGIAKVDFPHGDTLNAHNPALEHCHGMLDQMVEFVRDDRMGKAFRWLGFIQGALWSRGIYTLTELMNHSRPDPKQE